MMGSEKHNKQPIFIAKGPDGKNGLYTSWNNPAIQYKGYGNTVNKAIDTIVEREKIKGKKVNKTKIILRIATLLGVEAKTISNYCLSGKSTIFPEMMTFDDNQRYKGSISIEGLADAIGVPVYQLLVPIDNDELLIEYTDQFGRIFYIFPPAKTNGKRTCMRYRFYDAINLNTGMVSHNYQVYMGQNARIKREELKTPQTKWKLLSNNIQRAKYITKEELGIDAATNNGGLLAVIIFNILIYCLCVFLENLINDFMCGFVLHLVESISILFLLWALTHVQIIKRNKVNDLSGGFGMLGTMSATGVMIYLLMQIEKVGYNNVTPLQLVVGIGAFMFVAFIGWWYSTIINYQVFFWGRKLSMQYYK